MHAEVQRHPVAGYPATRMPDPVAALVDAERGVHYDRPGAFFEPRQFLTLTYQPPQDVVARTHRFLVDDASHTEVDYARELAGFEHPLTRQIGRASCSDRVSPSVSLSVVVGSFQKT